MADASRRKLDDILGPRFSREDVANYSANRKYDFAGCCKGCEELCQSRKAAKCCSPSMTSK
jgi:hypothetical protein